MNVRKNGFLNKKKLMFIIIMLLPLSFSLADSSGPDNLSEEEKQGILLMREEEKLARDVYLALYDKWRLPVFSNIADSEKQHMDSVKTLIDRYNLSDPVENDVRGIFVNANLRQLYDDLVTAGNQSLLSALKVGATIEDLDIYDLERLIKQTDKDDIKVVYLNLAKGSRNHLRSFHAQIERNGGEYTPQYIDMDYFEKIITTKNEPGSIWDPDYSFM